MPLECERQLVGAARQWHHAPDNKVMRAKAASAPITCATTVSNAFHLSLGLLPAAPVITRGSRLAAAKASATRSLF